MPQNRAAWLVAKKSLTLEVKSMPYTPPPAGRIVIKNCAVAINPVDWLIQRKSDLLYTWLKYPFVLGFDVAGEVAEVGKDVTRFKVGDRVLGFARGSDEKGQDVTETAFQEYPVLQADLCSHIPSSMSYESAAVIPLSVGTAAAGLFQKDQLGLQHPSLVPQPTGKTLIVWGGSTSIGANAIQLGTAAGYEVFTTCSPKNFDLVKRLGASRAFDYNSPTVISDMVAAFAGKTSAGALSIGHGAADACMSVLDKVQGDKFVSMATFPLPDEAPKSFVLLKTAYTFLTWTISFKTRGLIKGIGSNFLIGSTIATNEVGKMIFVDFLPEALKAGTFVAAPEPYVFGRGLENIQSAMDYQAKGVSAKKVVVSL